MTWNYSGDPAQSARDEVRFLVGDTDQAEQLVRDEEIIYAIGKFTTARLAAASLLRALASKFSRRVSQSVGSVSVSLSDAAKAFSERAKELDPGGLTAGVPLALPVFGGISYEKKEEVQEDIDLVPPNFAVGMNDDPEAPGNRMEFFEDERRR